MDETEKDMLNATQLKDNELKRFGRKTELEKQLVEMGGRKMVEEDGFESWVLDNPQEFLEKQMLKRDEVFHGSTRKITELRPAQAIDLHKESGNREAVYFSFNPVISIFCGLAGGIKEKVGERQNGCNLSYDEAGNIDYGSVYLAVEHPEKIANEGYVYLTSRVGMEFVGGEYLCYEPRVPDVALRIKRGDLKYNIEKVSND